MTLGDLIKTGWVKDSDTIIIFYGEYRRIVGNWYEDKVLNLMHGEIKEMMYFGDKWRITLKEEERENA